MSANQAILLQQRFTAIRTSFLVNANSKYNHYRAFAGIQTRYEDLLNDIWEHLDMPEKKKRTQAKWKSFVNIDIPENVKAKAKPIILDYENSVDRALEVIALGYKMTVGYEGSTDTYRVTLTGTYSDLPNAGLSLTGYGKHWMIALGSVMYKHFDIANGKWSETDSDSDELFG